MTFVLLHGSWHGGWAWKDVICHLSRKGCLAHAPTFAGHGPGAPRLGITHYDCVDSVVAYIHECGLSNIILVGHSFGGTVAQRVAAQVPNRIERLIFVDALVLAHNQCVYDNLPDQYVHLFNSLAAANSNNSMLIPWDIWRDYFMQDAPEPMARAFWERLSPEPNQVNRDKLDLREFYSLAIPKAFIYCRQDKALPPGHFHPRMSSRLEDYKLVEMDGSHEAMFTRPAELLRSLSKRVQAKEPSGLL